MPPNLFLGSDDIIGCYAPDTKMFTQRDGEKKIFFSTKSRHHLAILDLFQFDPKDEIRFTKAVRVDEDIRSTNSTELSADTLAKSFLDVRTNDLFVGAQRVCLNFLDKNIVITSREGIPKLYRPITSKAFPEAQGKILIYSVFAVNTPAGLRSAGYHDNPLETVKTRLINANMSVSKEVAKLLEYALQKCHEADPSISHTLKIVTVTTIDSGYVDAMNRGVEIYLHDKDLQISTKDIDKVELHNRLRPNVNDPNIIAGLRENGVSCYIVDNNNRIGDRYTLVAGMVKKIPKIKSTSQYEGLHILSLDEAKIPNLDDHIPLEKIDESRYIFKSQEEALNGADTRTRYLNETEERKIKLAEEALQNRQTYEDRIRRLEAEQREISMAHEQEKRGTELKHQKSISDMKVALELEKQETDRQKHHLERQKFALDGVGMERKDTYEQVRYTRDTTVELIKTVGAVAGLAATGYMIYKSFS